MRGLGAWSDQSWYQHWYIQYSMEQHIGAFRLSGQSVHSPKQVHGQLGMHEWALLVCCIWGRSHQNTNVFGEKKRKKKHQCLYQDARSALMEISENQGVAYSWLWRSQPRLPYTHTHH